MMLSAIRCPALRVLVRAVLIYALVFSTSYAHAQTAAAWHRTDDMVFRIAIYGPSDEIFIWWGHAALIVHNTRWNSNRVFDWGIFTYPSDDFLMDFINNEVRYRGETGSLDLDFYIEEDRDITVYTLNLDRRAKEAILSYAENSVRPENAYYDYHQFLDNCSTRIRDILDLGTGGQFKAHYDSMPGRMSFRQHVRRYTWFRPFSDWFLGFLMGQDLDRQITRWEEMFLPVEIARNIVEFSYIDESGAERRLVSSVQLYNSSKERPPILNQPLATWPITLGLGLLAAVVFFVIRRAGSGGVSGRIILGISQSLLGLFFGAAGCVLFFGLFLLKDDYIQQNINIIFINPLLLLIVPLGILSAINSPGNDRRIFFNQPLSNRAGHFFSKISAAGCLSVIWTYIFFAGVFSMLLWVFPFFNQQHYDVPALILPTAFVFSLLPERIFGYKFL